MSCLIPKSDDAKLPTSPKRGWKHLLRIFKYFKNSDDYHNHYYQYHIHFDDYKKQQRRSGTTRSSPVEATTVHEQVVAAARAFSIPRERARVHHCSEDGRHRNQRASGDDGENGEGVDADCEKFIEWFRETLKLERQISAEKEFQDMLDRSALSLGKDMEL